MGLITQEVEVEIKSNTIKHYEKLKYNIPRSKDKRGRITIKKGTKIRVRVEDLPRGNTKILLDFQCDGENCEKILKISMYTILNNGHNGKAFCTKCSSKNSGAENMRKEKLKNGLSLYQWCVDNDDLNILHRYDDIKNELNPKEISYGRAKIYLKCPNEIHPSEEKNILSYITGKGSLDCNMCNSLGVNYPESMDFWSEKNKKTVFEYSKKNGSRVIWKCGLGKHDDYSRIISNAVKFEFRCPECVRERDESFLQEKVRLYLEELCDKYDWKLNHEHKCSILPKNPKTIRSKNSLLPYDNELIGNNFNLIIETHGEQHYKICNWHKLNSKKYNTTPQQELEYIQWKDEYKKQYALNNGYYYLAIPYWADDENETYKLMIDDILNHIHENIQQEN